MNARPTEPEPAAGAGELRDRRLVAARVGLAGLASAVVITSVIGLPARYREYLALTDSTPATREVIRANLAELGLSVGFYAAYLLALGLVLTVACFAVAAVVFWRRSDEPMALFVAMLLVLLGATFSGSIGALGNLDPIWERLNGILNALSLALVFLFFYLFPDGKFVPRWTRWLVLLIAAYAAPTALFPDSPLSPENWPALPYSLLLGSLLLTGVFAQVHRYRWVSSPAQRQQTKWVVFGFTAALVGYLCVILLQVIFPALEPGTLADFVGITVTLCFMLLIPSSIAFAVLRYHLYGIDIIINRTLVYAALTISLVLVYIGSVVSLQAILRALVGESSQLAIVASTLAIAALFSPLRHRLQTIVDRHFYRRKYDARKTLEVFAMRLRDETDLDRLGESLVAAVHETMQPAHVSLWLKEPESHR